VIHPASFIPRLTLLAGCLLVSACALEFSGWLPPVGWRGEVVDAYQTVIKYGFYALVATPRWPRIRMMNRGLWDGLLGRGGAYRG